MQQLKFVAQQVMDKYLTAYRSDTDFFTLQDYIDYTGNAVADFYMNMWTAKYGELRQEKKDEVVTFDSGILSEQILTVPKEKKDKTSFTIPLTYPVMSFAYDQNNCGFQVVFISGDPECDEFDKRAVRSTLLQKNALDRTVICDRVFFYPDGNNLGIVNKRFLPVNKIKLYYVPSVTEDMIIPDIIVAKVIDATIISLKQSAAGVVVRHELGNNANHVMESSIDKSQLKP